MGKGAVYVDIAFQGLRASNSLKSLIEQDGDFSAFNTPSGDQLNL